jgi:hypothetical protein
MSDSIHRIGLAVATLTVIVTVGGFFAVDGYVSAQVAATSSLPPEIVYVRAASSPQTIQLTQTASPGPAQVVHVIVPGADGESDGGDD